MEAPLARPRARSVEKNVEVIRRSLQSIARSLASLIRTADAAARSSKRGGRRGRKLQVSPARRASLKLQGQYMGHLRGLGARQKARVKALRTKKGFRPAIALARKLAAG
jgi:hypothetical protein